MAVKRATDASSLRFTAGHHPNRQNRERRRFTTKNCDVRLLRENLPGSGPRGRELQLYTSNAQFVASRCELHATVQTGERWELPAVKQVNHLALERGEEEVGLSEVHRGVHAEQRR